MQTIMAVINRKGGVGKTTSSVNLATELALTGRSVLWIDIDPQSNGTILISGGSSEHDVSIADLLDNPKTPVKSAIKSSPYGVDYIPCVPKLSRILETLASRISRENILKKLLAQVPDYDYIIIDCPPDSSLGTLNAIVAAKHYLIPVDGGSFALNGLGDLLQLLDEVSENEGRAYKFMIVRNEYSTATKVMNGFLESQLTELHEHVLNTRIRRSEVIQQAVASCKPVRDYKPGSIAAQDFKDLAKEVIARTSNDL